MIKRASFLLTAAAAVVAVGACGSELRDPRVSVAAVNENGSGVRGTVSMLNRNGHPVASAWTEARAPALFVPPSAGQSVAFVVLAPGYLPAHHVWSAADGKEISIQLRPMSGSFVHEIAAEDVVPQALRDAGGELAYVQGVAEPADSAAGGDQDASIPIERRLSDEAPVARSVRLLDPVNLSQIWAGPASVRSDGEGSVAFAAAPASLRDQLAANGAYAVFGEDPGPQPADAEAVCPPLIATESSCQMTTIDIPPGIGCVEDGGSVTLSASGTFGFELSLEPVMLGGKASGSITLGTSITANIPPCNGARLRATFEGCVYKYPIVPPVMYGGGACAKPTVTLDPDTFACSKVLKEKNCTTGDQECKFLTASDPRWPDPRATCKGCANAQPDPGTCDGGGDGGDTDDGSGDPCQGNPDPCCPSPGDPCCSDPTGCCGDLCCQRPEDPLCEF